MLQRASFSGGCLRGHWGWIGARKSESGTLDLVSVFLELSLAFHLCLHQRRKKDPETSQDYFVPFTTQLSLSSQVWLDASKGT